MLKVAINGFGRIGRAAYKISHENPDIEIVAINDLTNPRILAHLLKYDSAYGVYDKNIVVEEDGRLIKVSDFRGEKDFFTTTGKQNYLITENRRTIILNEKDPTKLPWSQLGVDVVLECTGRFTDSESVTAHITAGAKKVVISAPASGDIETFLMGVNSDKYAGQSIISNASCTTNCISPVVAIIHDKLHIIKSAMSTIHAITAEQSVVDGPPPPLKPDMRRARSSGFNMIPTSTGAAKATTQVIPDLKNKFDGISVRVPIITGSVSDITMLVQNQTTVDDVNNILEQASKEARYAGILSTTWEPIVSSDIVKTTYSAIVDLTMTRVVAGDLVKILAWYDNEWGYSNRLVEMAYMIGTFK